jgi:hypothetical protein
MITQNREKTSFEANQYQNFGFEKSSGIPVLNALDNLIWYCGRFETKRQRLTDALAALDVRLGICVLRRSGRR